ncbi:MAG: hypothetical protein ACK5MF_06330 [Vibrio sp.]|uniref:hypothetical protein n=1 Tax=Vibrio sp. TaxID=678 RepID=UPI003A89A1F6
MLGDLNQSDFDWYRVESVDALVERGLPQIINEYTVDGDNITINVIDNEVVPDYDTMKVAFVFRNQFLPVYENGEFYVKPDGSYATLKRSNGYALLGIRNES